MGLSKDTLDALSQASRQYWEDHRGGSAIVYGTVWPFRECDTKEDFQRWCDGHSETKDAAPE